MRAAVTGSGQIDHIQIIVPDDPVEVGIYEILAGAGSPVPDDGLLKIFGNQRPFEQRIVKQIELAGSQIICGAPVCIYLFQLLFG